MVVFKVFSLFSIFFISCFLGLTISKKFSSRVKELKEIDNVFISKELIQIKDIKELENYKYILNDKESSSTKKLLELLKKYNVQI